MMKRTYPTMRSMAWRARYVVAQEEALLCDHDVEPELGMLSVVDRLVMDWDGV